MENIWPVIRSSLFESVVKKEFKLHDFGWYIPKLFQRQINCSTRPEKKAVDVIGTKLFVTARHREGVYLSYVAL